MLGLAGSNSVNLSAAVRIACTDLAFNVKTKHAVIKRVTDPWAAEGQKTKNRQYKTDPELMRRLQEYVSSLPVPYPNPEGHGTNRVPVRLLSNRPEEIVTMRRKCMAGPQLKCECNQWRPKTEAEAKQEGLPWPPPQDDRERYFVSLPRDEMGATWYDYDDKFRVSGTSRVACNPMLCKYAGGFVPDPAKKFDAKPCKPETEINCQLGDWGGGELCFVHAESWATAQRFNTSLAIIFQACGGNVQGIEVDVCLEYTKAQHVPGGSTTRHPYWVLGIPYGMSETAFRERAIQQRQKLLQDVGELARLNAASQQLLGEARMPWRQGALLPEFQPYNMLTEGNRVVTGIDYAGAPDWTAVSWTPDASRAIDALVETYGKTIEEAEAMVRANSADLGSMFTNLGPPPQTDEPDAEPPAIAGALEPEDEAPPAVHDDAEEGVFDDEPGPETAAPESMPEVQQEAVPEVQPEEVAPAPDAYTNESAPDTTGLPPALLDTPSLMFPTPPETCYQIEKRFEDLGELEDFWKLVSATWKKVAKQEKPGTLTPSPGTCNGDFALLDNLQKVLLAKAEGWWHTIGRAKHEAA
jgi:hypothetical protein